MSEKETPEERARSQAYAAGVESERHHTARAVVARDAAVRERQAIQALHLDALAQLAEARRAHETAASRLLVLARRLGATEGQLTQAHGDRLEVRRILDDASTVDDDLREGMRRTALDELSRRLDESERQAEALRNELALARQWGAEALVGWDMEKSAKAMDATDRFVAEGHRVRADRNARDLDHLSRERDRLRDEIDDDALAAQR